MCLANDPARAKVRRSRGPTRTRLAAALAGAVAASAPCEPAAQSPPSPTGGVLQGATGSVPGYGIASSGGERAWITVQTPHGISTVHCYATFVVGSAIPVVTCSPWIPLYVPGQP
jgi:hypothetical protein